MTCRLVVRDHGDHCCGNHTGCPDTDQTKGYRLSRLQPHLLGFHHILNAFFAIGSLLGTAFVVNDVLDLLGKIWGEVHVYSISGLATCNDGQVAASRTRSFRLVSESVSAAFPRYDKLTAVASYSEIGASVMVAIEGPARGARVTAGGGSGTAPGVSVADEAIMKVEKQRKG